MVARLSETAEHLRAAGSEEEAASFEAHVEFAEDPELNSGVEERVRELESPEAAVLAVGEGCAGVFAAMEDEYMAARADDVRDLASQIAAEVMGRAAEGLEALETPSVVGAATWPRHARRFRVEGRGDGRRERSAGRLQARRGPNPGRSPHGGRGEHERAPHTAGEEAPLGAVAL